MTVNSLIIDVDVFGGAAILLGIGLGIVFLLTGERADPFRSLDAQRPTDDPGEWTGPLQTGSRSAERAMIRFHKEHGLLLWKRTSDAGRKLVVAVEKHRPRRGETGWGRHASPVPEPPLNALPPEPAPDPGEHFDVGGSPVEERLPLYSWQTGEFTRDMVEELVAKYMPDGAA